MPPRGDDHDVGGLDRVGGEDLGLLCGDLNADLGHSAHADEQD